MPFTKNDQFLHAERILISEIKIGSPPSRRTSTKLNNYRQQIEKKNSNSIVSFFKITKAKSMQKKIHQEEYEYNQQINSVPKKQSINHKNLQPQCNQNQTSFSQIGSEYGDYNYDNQLHEVLKRKKHSPRQPQKTSKVIFRVATCQNQVPKTTQCQRFEKLKTQIHQKTTIKLKQATINYDEIKTKKMEEMQSCQMNIKPQMMQKIGKYSTKQKLKRYQSSQLCAKPMVGQIQQKISSPGQQSIVFGSFLHIINKRLEPCSINQRHKLQPSAHRRSQTQHNPDTQTNKEKGDKIFQNYKKLKETFRKISSTYRERLNSNRKLEKQNDHMIELGQSKLQKQQENSPPKCYFNSMPKNKKSIIFQDIYARQQFLTTRACLTPKSESKCKITDMAMRKMIKNRQKDFFQQPSTKRIESPLFTFEQIKSKLAKLQERENTKRHNKSLAVINGVSNQLLPKEFLIGITKFNQSPKIKENNSKKSKGFHMKSNNLMKKHNEFYQKHMKKQMQMEQFSRELLAIESKTENT